MIPQSEKQALGLYGDYRVLAELILRGYSASITMGNTKGTDLIILDKTGKFLRVEVKTSKNLKNFVTGYFPKYKDKNFNDPDIWVFYLPGYFIKSEDLYYILTHQQVREAQLIVNKGNETKAGKGVDNIPIKILESYFPNSKNNWEVIETLL